MDTEDMVRSALRDEVDGIELTDWPAVPMRARMRRRQRGRRGVLAMTAAVVATGVAALSGALLTEQPGEQMASPAAAASLSPGLVWPKVVVVQPGQQLNLGGGNWMKLTSDEICTHIEPTPGCGGYSWASGSTGITVQDLAGLYSPIYHGPEQVARMAVVVDGTVYPVTVVTLPGHPGYATGYVQASLPKAAQGSLKGQVPTKFPLDGVELIAYDAQGKVLASRDSES